MQTAVQEHEKLGSFKDSIIAVIKTPDCIIVSELKFSN
jgi:hypothetical protein